jgi:hypothetical protein
LAKSPHLSHRPLTPAICLAALAIAFPAETRSPLFFNEELKRLINYPFSPDYATPRFLFRVVFIMWTLLLANFFSYFVRHLIGFHVQERHTQTLPYAT